MKKVLRKILSIAIATSVVMACFVTTAFATTTSVGVSYSAHVQNIGWMAAVTDGVSAGTTGQSLRVEAFKISLTNAPAGAHINYQTHVQDKGWVAVASDGAIGGSVGESKRVEAIAMTISGMAGYSIEYRVHVQDIGWMSWVKNGAITGTVGQSKRIEAIQIRIVAPAVLAVASITATDALSIKVAFNNAVNKASAETVSNYLMNNAAMPAGTTATLQADLKTVLLTLPVASKLISGTSFLASVSNVMGTDLVPLAATYTTAVAFSDTTAPSLSAVSYTNNTTAKVSFSEPMAIIAAGQVFVYNAAGTDVTSATLKSIGLAAGATDLYVDLTGATANTTYTVKIYGALDLSGNAAGTQSFNVVKTNSDTTAPTVVSVVSTGLDTIKITFSEKIATDTTTPANGYGALTVAGLTGVPILTSATADVKTATVDSTTGTILTVVLKTSLAAGLHTVSVVNFLDASQNKQTTAYSKLLDFEQDITAPSVISTSVATINGVNVLLVKFDDSDIVLSTNAAGSAILAGTYINSNILYTYATFGTASLYDPNGTGATDTISIPLTTLSAGLYSANVNASVVKDKASTANNNIATAITFDYNAVNSVKPVLVDDGITTNGISSLVAQAPSSPNTIQLVFNKDVTAATALNVNNYLVDGTVAFSSAVFVGNYKTVQLTLKASAIPATANYSFSISGVADTLGNVMNSITFVQGFVENVKPTVSSATVTGSGDTITVVFSEAISSLTATNTKANADLNFTVKSGSTTITLGATPLATADGKTYVITLATALTAAQVTAGITLTVNTTNAITDISSIHNAFGTTATTVSVG